MSDQYTENRGGAAGRPQSAGSAARPGLFQRLGTLVNRLTGLGPAKPATPYKSFYSLSAEDLDGNVIDFERFRGKVVMVANVASFDPASKQHYQARGAHGNTNNHPRRDRARGRGGPLGTR